MSHLTPSGSGEGEQGFDAGGGTGEFIAIGRKLALAELFKFEVARLASWLMGKSKG